MSYEKMAEMKARWIPVYLVLIVAAALVAAHFIIMYFMTGNSGYANLALLTAFAIYFLYTGLDRLRKLKITRMRFIEVVTCEACGFREEKELETGDYIFKQKGPCPKCGGPLTVTAIYSLREQL
jgi:predicted nucleic-acid-binding Zn-ribbon protein